MVTERGLQVLEAIVQGCIDTNEPVGSRTIVERHGLGVSAATIRNDMALLEEEELIETLHTSSGRVPTDKGYRVFVDHLTKLHPLSSAQRSAITRFLADPTDIDDMLTRTARILTKLTGQVALLQYPVCTSASVSHIELVRIAEHRILVLVVVDSGKVLQRTCVLRNDPEHDEIQRMKQSLQVHFSGASIDEVEAIGTKLLQSAAQVNLTEELVRAVIDAVTELRQERLIMAGAASLARRGQDFRGSIHPLLEAIEEQVAVLRLMGEMISDEHGLSVSIGRENEEFGLEDASIVASSYDASGASARVGLLGPVRMDYSRNLAAVRAVARYLNMYLNDEAAQR